MKKLIFLLLLSPLAVLSQNKIVIKTQQVTISSLAPIAANTVVANNSSGIAVPTAVPLAIGLKFYPGIGLGIDTANFKDTIYAQNGLSILGVGFNRIGLGGFLSQNTNISGSNAWALTIESMQAATGRGFRVNFGSDAGFDMIYRDSATGFWTRGTKGTVGQVWTMLGTGGLGWANSGGGITTVGAFSGSSIANGASISGSTITFGPADGTNPGMVKASGSQTFGPTITFTNAPILTTSSTVGYVWTATGTGGQGGWAALPSTGLTRQNITSGSSGTVTGGNYLVKFNPASTISTYTLTLPASPSDLQTVEIEFGGTITSGTVVTSLTVLANSGQTLIDNAYPTSATTVNYMKWVYDGTLNIWYRRNP